MYSKPHLMFERFDLIEDVLTASSPDDDEPGFDGEQNIHHGAAPNYLEYVNDLTVEDPSGAFDPQISGGNPIQEALNTLYENFVDRS